MIWWLLALFLDRIQLKVGLPNYGAKYNGLGAVDDVLARRAPAPVAYRVLVPGLIGVAEWVAPGLRPRRLTWLYEPLKIGLMGAALAMTAHALGNTAALLVAVLLPATFAFDYWDWPVEMFGLAAALSGDLTWTLIGALACALSRETALLVPLAYTLVTLDWYGGTLLTLIVAGTLMIVRLAIGPRQKYWAAQMWRVNWQDIVEIGVNRPWYLGEITFALLISGLMLVSVIGGYAGPSWPVPLVVLILCWTLARAAEVRIFSAGLLWVAVMLLHVLT
jgi:hypothetical protein